MQLIDFFIHKLDTTLNLSWKVSELQMILNFFAKFIVTYLMNITLLEIYPLSL